MKIIRYVTSLIILSGIIALMTQCNKKKDDPEELKAKERKLLDQYLADNDITTEPTASGLYYIMLQEGSGAQPVDQDFVEVQYTGELIDGTVFSTTYDSVAKQENIYDKEIVYGPYRFQLGYTLPGLNEGIALMHAGEKALFILPSDLALGENSIGVITSYSTLIYNIDLVSVIHDPDEWELGLLQAYLDTLKIDTEASLDSVYYIENTAGTGAFIKNLDLVEVYYTGYYLDGRVFDTNVGGNAVVFTVSQQNIITGLNEGIRKMRNGGKGTLIIPYRKAYGASGWIDWAGRTRVGPYMTVAYDIHVTDVN